jgi:hypothetical protein
MNKSLPKLDEIIKTVETIIKPPEKNTETQSVPLPSNTENKNESVIQEK